MCLKPARLATALGLVMALAAASPAFALFGSHKPKATETAKTAKVDPKAQPSPAAPPEEPKASKADPAQRAAADRLDALAQAVFWGREAGIDPTDAEAGIKLARALRALGRYDEAAQAAQAVLVVSPKNVEAMLEDARAKIAAGQAFYAIESAKMAAALAPKDWRPPSILGVALQETQRPDEALKAYQQALALSPDNPAVLTNLALFYASRGDGAQAEALLRKAVAGPGAGVQERQNLALVLGLEGKLAEAERLMRQDLPPEVANANLAYLAAGKTPPSMAPSAAAPGPQAKAAPPTRTWNAVEGAQAPAR